MAYPALRIDVLRIIDSSSFLVSTRSIHFQNNFFVHKCSCKIKPAHSFNILRVSAISRNFKFVKTVASTSFLNNYFFWATRAHNQPIMVDVSGAKSSLAFLPTVFVPIKKQRFINTQNSFESERNERSCFTKVTVTFQKLRMARFSCPWSLPEQDHA